MTPDVINGVFEAFGAVFAWVNAYKLYKDQSIKGVYWPLWIVYTLWGFWNLYYYPALHQWVSFSSGAVLVFGNLAWVYQAARLWRKSQLPSM